ncbi:MAG: ATP-binding cassette domain-containing protein [Gammaproteobacteria bacterium]|nr:ATP-binding cassette domain-containing protein [Gammaproteobacteria bacterium]
MPLLRLEKANLAYGHKPLLENADLEIFRGERVCLLGRNGEGKTSMMRLLAGQVQPDDGKCWVRPGIRVAQLSQEADLDSDEIVFNVVAEGLPGLAGLLSEYHAAAVRLATDSSDAAVNHLSDLQHKLEAANGWQLEQRVETVLSRLGLDGDAPFSSLSGGWRRRAMLAQALVSEPDILLLDEPTNHLDIEAIAWLEEFLLEYTGALMFISHDRAFVRGMATRILELDRGRLSSWPGDYDAYLRGKAEQLETEARHNALFDKRLSEEEVWIRQGIKARRTRNEGRVRALEAMREQRRQRRELGGSARLQLDSGESSGKLVFEAKHVNFGYGENTVIRDFSTRIMRGDKVGIIGPNGAGKSTLVKLLLGQLEPDRGTLTRGTKLEVAYFDQQRAQLDPEKSVMDNVADGNQHIMVSGNRRHVASYLQDFLFPPERLQSPVKSLSGGERNRLLLARQFTQPANVLVMDEPTNDLDVETLELLEELISQFPGTLLLVSHDRAFLDNVVTGSLVITPEGNVDEYVGGYSDWLRQRPRPGSAVAAKPKTPDNKTQDKPSGTPRQAKLSYKEQRELDALPARIEELEKDIGSLTAKMGEASFYQQDKDTIQATLTKLERANNELETVFERWAILEGRDKPGA